MDAEVVEGLTRVLDIIREMNKIADSHDSQIKQLQRTVLALKEQLKEKDNGKK